MASQSWVQITAMLLTTQAWPLPLLPSSEQSRGWGHPEPGSPAWEDRRGRHPEAWGEGSQAGQGRQPGRFPASVGGSAGRQAESCRPPPGRMPAQAGGRPRRAPEEDANQLIDLPEQGMDRGAAAQFACPAASGHKGHRKASTPGPENWLLGLAVPEAGSWWSLWKVPAWTCTEGAGAHRDPAGLQCGRPWPHLSLTPTGCCRPCQGSTLGRRTRSTGTGTLSLLPPTPQ